MVYFQVLFPMSCAVNSFRAAVKSMHITLLSIKFAFLRPAIYYLLLNRQLNWQTIVAHALYITVYRSEYRGTRIPPSPC